MSGDQQETQAQAFGRIVAKAWSDEAFKQRLLADPTAVLRENGIELAAGMQVQVHEETATQTHLVLPLRPDGLSDDELEAVAGGSYAGQYYIVKGE